MNEHPSAVFELQARLENIIRRMQKIKQPNQASRQSVSRLELMEPGNPGREYACIIEQLADLPEVDPG